MPLRGQVIREWGLAFAKIEGIGESTVQVLVEWEQG